MPKSFFSFLYLNISLFQNIGTLELIWPVFFFRKCWSSIAELKSSIKTTEYKYDFFVIIIFIFLLFISGSWWSYRSEISVSHAIFLFLEIYLSLFPDVTGLVAPEWLRSLATKEKFRHPNLISTSHCKIWKSCFWRANWKGFDFDVFFFLLPFLKKTLADKLYPADGFLNCRQDLSTALWLCEMKITAMGAPRKWVKMCVSH